MPNPLSVEAFFVCAFPLMRGCIWERSCVLPNCICSNPQWRFPVWEVLVDEIVEILLCEGGDVELCAQTSKHILVFAIDPLSLTLSLSLLLCTLHWFILSYHTYMLGCVVCVPHLCLTKRASYSTSTLIQRNLEEIVQSLSPGIRLHSLVTLSVLQLVFFNSTSFVIRLVLHLFTPL